MLETVELGAAADGNRGGARLDAMVAVAAGELGGRQSRSAALRAGYGLKTTKLVINQGQDMGLREALAMEYQIIDHMSSPEERQAEIQKAASRSATYAKIFKAQGSSSQT